MKRIYLLCFERKVKFPHKNLNVRTPFPFKIYWICYYKNSFYKDDNGQIDRKIRIFSDSRSRLSANFFSQTRASYFMPCTAKEASQLQSTPL